MELDSERRAQQGLEAELVVTREALVVSNNKSSYRPTLARRLMIFLPVLFFLHWFIWTWMQLPLAVVSRIDSAHVYAEMSEAWMTMSEAGWFEGSRRLAAPRKAEKRRKNMKETRLFLSEIYYLPFLRDRDLRKWLKGLFRVDYSFCEAHSGNVVKKLDLFD